MKKNEINDYTYIKDYLQNQNLNYLNTYLGENKKLDIYINETIKIFNTMILIHERLLHKTEFSEREDVIDSIIFIGRGLEICNSIIHLTLTNHIPSQYYLLRSCINCFWFSYLSLTNPPNPYNSKKDSFRDEYNKEFNSRLSNFEISDFQLSKIVNPKNKNFKTKLVNEFNGILHGSFDYRDLFSKNNLSEIRFDYSPCTLDSDMLDDKIETIFIHIRGILEFGRVIITSIYKDCNYHKIYSLFNSDNIGLNNVKDYEKLLLYFENIDEVVIN